MREEPIEYPTESIRLYTVCAGMEWAVLPVEGGLYDQHPQLLDEWQEIRVALNDKQEAERVASERKAKGKTRR